MTIHVCSAQNKSRIDIGRLQRLSSAFGRYTVSGLTVTNPPAAVTNPAGGPSAPVLDGTAKEALRLVFSPEGSYAQVIIFCCKHISAMFLFLVIIITRLSNP